VLKFLKLVASDSEEGIEEDTGRWGRDVMVEKRRRRREDILAWEECVLDSVAMARAACFEKHAIT